MDFETWLQSGGFKVDALTETQRTTLRGLFRWARRRGKPTGPTETPAPIGRTIRAIAWSRAYVNDLPDSAFLFVERGGKKDEGGRTVPRGKRHFPYRDADGDVDLAHLRNAIARIPQSTAPGLTPAKKKSLQNKARRLLEQANKAAKKAKAAATLNLVATAEVSNPVRTRTGLEPQPNDCPDRLVLVADAGALELLAAADEDQRKLPRFRLVAYTGAAMTVDGWPRPVVVALDGLTIGKRPTPVLRDHDRGQIVGHTTDVRVDGARLRVEGVISGTGPAAAEVRDSGANGFPWQVSIGARVTKVDAVAAGQIATANGKTFEGPVYIARKATLGEVSFTAIGADDGTTATVAARRAGHDEDRDMDFETWIKGQGFDPEALTDQQRAFFKTLYAMATNPPPAGETDGDGDSDAEGAGTNQAGQDRSADAPPIRAAQSTPPSDNADGPNPVANAVEAERQRTRQILAACEGIAGDEVVNLRARALAGELGLADLQAGLLGVVRSSRQAPAAITSREDRRRNRGAIEAAVCLAARLPEDRIVAWYGPDAPEAGYGLRGMGIQELCARAAALEGVRLPRYGTDPGGWLKAAFSTMSVPGILGSTANRMLLDSYMQTEQAWREFCSIATVRNFLQHTRYRLTATTEFQQVAKDGELQHAQVDEQTYTQQADTFGILFGITRQDIINDDMGAFTQTPRLLGRGAGDRINTGVYTLLLGNTGSYFASGNSNYATGAATALAMTSLSTAVQMFLDQTRPDGHPVGVEPSILLVPTALKTTAEQLYVSLELREGGGSSASRVPTRNTHAGKYKPVCSAYLSNATLTGYSSLAWYLFANPAVLAAVEVAFLDGVDKPTVEQADADFHRLGVVFRGYIDFGVAFVDPRAAVKMKGET